MTHRWLAPIILLLLVACGAPSYKWDPLKLEELPTAKDHPQADELVLLDTKDIRFESDPETGEPVAVVTLVWRERFFRERGAARASSYYNENVELVSLDARLTQPPLEGDKKPETKTLDRSKAVEAPQAGTVIYDDATSVSVAFSKGVRPGSVFESRVVQRVKNPRIIPQSFSFGDRDPVQKTRFTVSFPSDWAVDYKALQMGEVIEWPPTKREVAGRTELEWSVENIPAFQPESYAPSRGFRGKRVSLWLSKWREKGVQKSGFESLKALSAHQAEMNTKPIAEDMEASVAAWATAKALEGQVDELLAGVPDEPRAKTQRLYDWVRQNIRYISVNLGLGGWVPTPAKETRARLYGDCKDKANLLKAMLAHAGIKSRIGVLMSASDGFRNPYTLPTVAGNANHAILIVDLPDGPLFLDSTDRSIAFGTLPFRDQNAPILPISKAGDDLLTTPGSDATQNWRETKLNIQLDTDGSAEGEFTYSALGTQADYLRSSFVKMPEGRRPAMMSTYLESDTFSVSDINGVEALEPPDAKTPIVVSGALHPTRLMLSPGASAVVRLADLVDAPIRTLRRAERSAPLLLGPKRRLKATVQMVLDEGMTPGPLPDAVVVNYPFAKASLSWRLSDGALVMERTVEYLQSRLPASGAAEYMEFVRQVQAASATPVLLQRGGGA